MVVAEYPDCSNRRAAVRRTSSVRALAGGGCGADGFCADARTEGAIGRV
jgi:hypothetical protein